MDLNPFNWFRSTDTDDIHRVEHDHDDEEQCDHEWGEWGRVDHIDRTPIFENTLRYPSRVENGYLIVPAPIHYVRHCEHCDERQENIEPREVAIEIDYDIGEGANLSDALYEDKRDEPADYAADADGDIEAIPTGENPGCVLVNESEREREPEADGELPVKAGGATD